MPASRCSAGVSLTFTGAVVEFGSGTTFTVNGGTVALGGLAATCRQWSSAAPVFWTWPASRSASIPWRVPTRLP
jgi:hypothetical protein